ncbi:MAG: glycine cleavage T C-terminal barrel domain-containing protein [Planctomycetota bacterium]
MPNADHDYLESLGAELIGYGPAASDPIPPLAMAEDYGAFEQEYAALRRHVGVLHLPQLGVLQVTGEDRKDFLHRMLSQQVNELTGGQSLRTMQLDAEGHVLADGMIHHGDASTWLEFDRFDIPGVRALFDQRLFAEDVTLEDVSEQYQGLALIGPAAMRLLDSVASHTAEGMSAKDVGAMAGKHHVLTINGTAVTAYRQDLGTTLGIRLVVPARAWVDLHRRLLDAAGYEPFDNATDLGEVFAQRRRESLRGRPVGWAAYNTARIESGLPLYHIDFGPDSVPAEAGASTVERAVSLTKGCWLGQEAVARMHNLSHPKRVIAGLKFQDDALPVAGTQVFEADEDKRSRAPRGGQVGGVTSSTLSPLLGRCAIALAVMKWGKHRPGTVVAVPVGGEMVQAKVVELPFV